MPNVFFSRSPGEIAQKLGDPRAQANGIRELKPGDFAYRTLDFGWVYFLRPHDATQSPRSAFDGRTIATVPWVDVTSFDARSLESGLRALAVQFGLTVRELEVLADDGVYDLLFVFERYVRSAPVPD